MKEHNDSSCHRNLPSSYDSGAQVRYRGCSLTDRLKVRATRPPAQGRGTKAVPRQGYNTPFPLERSAPPSFKRLLGAAATGPLGSFSPRHRNRLLSPRTQRVGILNEVLRHLVVLYGLTVLAIGPEWTHAACLEER